MGIYTASTDYVAIEDIPSHNHHQTALGRVLPALSTSRIIDRHPAEDAMILKQA
jgi:hypothetical protein